MAPSWYTLRNRGRLLRWLAHVAEEKRFARHTWHLAAHYVDRFVERTPSWRLAQAQMLGAAALLVASKLEEPEGRAWTVASAVHLCCNQFGAAELVACERQLLITLDWCLVLPTAVQVLFDRLGDQIQEHSCLLSIVDAALICWPALAPSAVAAAALALRVPCAPADPALVDQLAALCACAGPVVLAHQTRLSPQLKRQVKQICA
jgi:hypothetical protein